MNMIEQINQYLLDTENFSNEFLPIRETLMPVKNDLDIALKELMTKAQNSTDVADKVFYINRYTDLVKKVESIFDAHNKRLLNILQTSAKLTASPTDSGSQKNLDNNDEDDKVLTPEQCSAIIKILNQ